MDTSHTPALGYMEVVRRRDAATLLQIITAHTAPDSVIHSHQWAAYRGGDTAHCCCPWRWQPLFAFCGAHDWCSYPKYWARVKTAEENEGVPCLSTSQLLRQVYVGTVCQGHSSEHNGEYFAALPSLTCITTAKWYS